ncbi:MAG: pyridoxamine 5'-phosphate oxidase family protein, partial [Pseudomonadota bacterium]
FADYVGNNFFNTHGNLRIDGRVGIQVLEFESGDVLHLTGKAQLAQVKTDNLQFPDTGRRVRVSIETIAHAPASMPFEFSFLEFSPMLPGR